MLKYQPPTKEKLSTAAMHLFDAVYSSGTEFYPQLIALILKADPLNKARLQLSFPAEVAVVDEWQNAKVERDFWFKYGYEDWYDKKRWEPRI